MVTMIFENAGYYYCCDRNTKFVASTNWFRDHYKCSTCGSIPRERALMYCVEKFFPHWRGCVIHESCPAPRGASLKLKAQAKNYLATQYFPGVVPGTMHQGFRCENLESLTFADESIDLHVTQDVLEHVFHPSKVFREIARTLKPGGAHIFTVPLVNKDKPTEECARLDPQDNIIYLRKADYHANPV